MNDKFAQRIDNSRALLGLLRYIDVLIIVAFVTFLVWRRDFGVHFWIGIAIGAVGIFLWAVARAQLGASFSVGPQARRLVTTGLYSKLRHPIYLFGGIGYLGLFIALGNWIALALFLVFCCSYLIPRVRKEEKVLEATFGEDYRRYKASTWF